MIERQPMRTAFVLVVYFVLFPLEELWGTMQGEAELWCCQICSWCTVSGMNRC
jgi:hypothetical protein